MAVLQSQVTIPDDGTPVQIYPGLVSNSAQVNIRNTGVAELSLGPPSVLAPPLNFLADAHDDEGGTFVAGTYYWQVTAVNAYGETVGSREVNTFVQLNGTVTLTWDAVAGALTYNVYRATTAQGESVSPSLVGASLVVTNYTDIGAASSGGAAPLTNDAQISLLYPLKEDEVLQYTSHAANELMAQVSNPGTPGQVTILTLG